MRTMRLAVLLLVGAATAVHAATRTIDFNEDVNQPPKGFEFGHTAGVGRPPQLAELQASEGGTSTFRRP